VPEARLAGEGEYTWFGMRIYQAQLWVGRKATRARRPQRRRSCWNCATRALDGRKIAEASYEQMQKLGARRRSAWRGWPPCSASFPDVKEGQRIAGAYRAGIAPGVRFYLDGKVLADVSDGDFARAFSPSGCRPSRRRRSCARRCCRCGAAAMNAGASALTLPPCSAMACSACRWPCWRCPSIYVAPFYAQRSSLDLAQIGAVLLAARIAAAFIDPALGAWMARGGRMPPASAPRCPCCCWALAPCSIRRPCRPATLAWFLAALLLVYTAYGLASIAHQSWGAALTQARGCARV
jgi:hypothetical protein